MNIRKAEINDAYAISKICTDDLEYKCTVELVSDRLKNIDENREVVYVAETNRTVVG